MKTATLPSLRVEPELRQAAEEVLREGESLSAFVEDAVRRDIHRRKINQEFLARALAAEAEAEETSVYYSAEEVLQEIDEIIANAEAKSAS